MLTGKGILLDAFAVLEPVVKSVIVAVVSKCVLTKFPLPHFFGPSIHVNVWYLMPLFNMIVMHDNRSGEWLVSGQFKKSPTRDNMRASTGWISAHEEW